MAAKLWGTNFPFYKGNTLLGVTSKVLPRQEDSDDCCEICDCCETNDIDDDEEDPNSLLIGCFTSLY
ncbi:hypothetical protein CCP1ISM_10520001 [Azospirillaceae bacterium]